MAINEVPGFLKYKDAEGNLNLLLPITTKDNVDGMDEIETALEETVRFTEQTLTEEQKSQARENIYAASLDDSVTQSLRNALKILFGSAVYTSDQSVNIAALNKIFKNESDVTFNITNNLFNATTNNATTSATSGDYYKATLSANIGQTLESIRVIMGGIDVTDNVCFENSIVILDVTGDVVIDALAAAHVNIAKIEQGSQSYASNGLTIYRDSSTSNRAIICPIGQSMSKGITYKFSLGDAAQNYYMGIVTFTISNGYLPLDPSFGTNTTYSNVTARLLDSGWIKTDYEYKSVNDDVFFIVVFKNNNNSALNEDDYRVLLDNVSIDVVVEDVTDDDSGNWVFVEDYGSGTDNLNVTCLYSNTARQVIAYSTGRVRLLKKGADKNYVETNSNYYPRRILPGDSVLRVNHTGGAQSTATILKWDATSNYYTKVTDISAVNGTIDISQYNNGEYYTFITFKSSDSTAANYTVSIS